jgi:hypothetical protein
VKSQIKCNDTTNENIPNTSAVEANARYSTRGKYTLSDLHRLTFNLDGVGETLNVEECSAEQFNAFAQAVADVEDVDVSVWPLEERRNLVNELWDFCQAENFEFPLTDSDAEETIQTQPLEQKESGFLHDVERAKPVMEANPEITSQELAAALGLKSAIYAHTIKVYVNAQKSAKEGTNDAE